MKPAALTITFLAALAACGPGTGSTESSGVFFPTWDASGGAPDALLEGATLVQRDGCLFAHGGIPTPRGGDTLLLWPDGFRFEDGRVLDASGREITRVGGPFTSGGGFLKPEVAETDQFIGEPIPPACRAPGESVWLVGDIEPLVSEG